MLRNKPPAAAKAHPAFIAPSTSWARPVWARFSPFPSDLLVAPAHGQEKLLLTLLFLTVVSSAIVQFDIIYNLLAVLSSALFLLLGIRLDRGNMPFIFMLMVFNIGGLIALQPYLASEESSSFIVGTCFVAITGIFYSLALNENAIARLEAIRWGVIIGATIASIAGLLAYAGLNDAGLMYGARVMGTFRDANVFGSFAAAGAVMLASSMLTSPRFRLIKLAMLIIISVAVILSFSRGSWANLAFGLIMLFVFSLITTPDKAMRARLMLAALAGAVILVIALAVMLANDDISNILADRFVLKKDYDSGPSGRFGNQIRAIPDLLERPFGHGPNRFSFYYPENPHNTYMMAFSTYGWLGGITFMCFSVSLIYVSLRAALTRSPFQNYAVMAFAVLVPHMIQNFQIDTDRWRHLFMIYGLSWGVAVITARYMREYRGYAHAAYRATAARVPPQTQPSPPEASANPA